jgi:uroporphyrinogen-III synthase
VVTRPAAQADGLVGALEEAGARAVRVPVIAITDPADGGAALAEAVDRRRRDDWVVVTSANGAERLVDAGRLPEGVRVAAIGPGTAGVLARGGLVPDLVPEAHVGEGLVEAFPPPPPSGGRVLLVQAEAARATVREGLAAAGWDVEVAIAYRTVPASPSPEVIDAARGADAVTFTSSSTVRNFIDLLGGPEAVTATVACIGPITAATARDAGLRVAVQAVDHTVAGLVASLCDHFGSPE